MLSFLLYGCETWPAQISDGRMLEVFNNDIIHRIIGIRRKDCVPSVELRRRLCITSIPALLVQGRLRRFGPAAIRPEGDLIKDLHLPTPPRTWCGRAEDTRPAEDMGKHDQGQPGTAFRAVNLRSHKMEKGLGESV